ICVSVRTHSDSHLIVVTRFLLFRPLFFSNDTAPTEIYTLSLHDALPIYEESAGIFENKIVHYVFLTPNDVKQIIATFPPSVKIRSEEHTSELQSRFDLVCRLLLEKKKTQQISVNT